MSEVLTPQEQLPFSKPRQDAILGHLLTNESFFRQAKAVIHPTWFVDPYNTLIWAAKVEFFAMFKRIPSTDELKESRGFASQDQAQRNRMYGRINECTNATERYRLDAIRPELTTWLHARLYHEGMHASQALYNNGKFSEAYVEISRRLKLIKEVSFEADFEMSFENYVQFFDSQNVERLGALSFGSKLFDRLLYPPVKADCLLDETPGSLLKGDMTLLMAPTNIGKTTAMITTAVHNIRHRKNVLFLSHEGRSDDLMTKFWCCIMGIDRPSINAAYMDPRGRHSMDQALVLLKDHLTYIPLNKAGLTIEEVEATIRKWQEKKIAMTGRGYDLVVDDYPAKLGSSLLTGKAYEKRNVDEYVYDQFVQMALEHKFHCLVAQQINRTGSKINHGTKGYEARLLTHDDAAESAGPGRIATNCITLNRSPQDEAQNRLIYYISKSRSSATGYAVVCRTNFAAAKTHSDEMGATYYRGTVLAPDGTDLDQLMREHKSGDISTYLVGSGSNGN